jgi:hypothetical protein
LSVSSTAGGIRLAGGYDRRQSSKVLRP